MRRSDISRRTPLQRKPFRPVVRLNLPKAREARKLYAELRQALCERAHGCCERCGKPSPLPVGTVHHRQKQSQGGPDDSWNCVWACYSCNGGWIEDFPIEATRLGWTVPSWANPREWPVLMHRHGKEGWFQPTPTGWRETTAHPSQIEGQETA